MEALLSVILGVGLSAACGFRVFLPVLVMGIAGRAGHLELSGPLQWISSDAALLAMAAATVLEIGAYFVPWLDNLLDTIASPTAVVAGILVSASVLDLSSPFLTWTVAAIAGGGAAGVIQTTTAVVRAASTASTGGLGNPVVSAAEAGGALFVSALAILAPLAGLVLALVAVWLIRRRRRAAQLVPTAP